jgi:hypothetical protein
MAAIKHKAIEWDAFGNNAYSCGLVHLMTSMGHLRCGGHMEHKPPLRVASSAPVTCLQCITLESRFGP